MSDRYKSVIKSGVYSYATSVNTASGAIGATGDYLLAKNIPAGSIVTAVFFNSTTALSTGSSPTMNLKVVDDAASPNTITITATAQGAATVFATNTTDKIALNSSANAIKVTTNSNLYVTIATAAVTAGIVRFFVHYTVPA